ncbi:MULTISPECIES: xanthine dehydrogenase family protein molybdopterin-binding subunit [Stenotrophomonas]|uniref:xanthine dehydrogenase family protein molybdopterin-binding subunit n=1 Tax=Stenotrophomonas TaxID=40323 RepID=UPI00087235FE|nr:MULTISPECIES: xanthine dehydrogenase family protein molybdopterin-binding subunit [Stenotrophomonas]OEZ02659.1 aldehyde oxidase [Stenotrophomonas sp. BIIR7]
MNLPNPLHPPVAPAGTGHVPTGTGTPRIDGRAKVTGQARYAAEWPAQDLVYGVAVNSTIAKGRILGFSLDEANAVPGVIRIITHDNRPKMRGVGLFYKDMTAPAGKPFRPLYDDKVLYSGQPVALVLAETFEAAREAAGRVQVHYETEAHDTNLLAAMQRARPPKKMKAGFSAPPKDKGTPDEAFAEAPFKITAAFYHGVEHHNPMELFASTVIRGDDGHLTIYDKTQGSQNSRWYVSQVFGLPKRKVTVRNPFVGGAFGAGLRPQYQLALAVMGSLALERSVRVVMTRQQMFTFGHRAETVQRVKLAADADGTLRSIWHEAVAETSRMEDYVEVVVNWSGQLYACDNVHLGYKVVDLDQYTPIDMRAPGAAHGVHALEVAMDELAASLDMDPLALRLKNYAEVNPADGKPYSSKALRECYQRGAERFGWAQRAPQPRARREGNEWVGWGMATGQWDAMQMFARARAELHADGRLVVSSAATDIGTGTYTVMSMIAAEALGLPLEQVSFQLGDSTLPVAPIEGGSSHVSTVGSAVEGACTKLRRRLLALARLTPRSPFARARLDDVVFQNGTLALRDDPNTAVALTTLLSNARRRSIDASYLLLPNVLEQRKYTRATHSAVFVEVRVDEDLGTVRVMRVVSAIAAGRILNPTTARSQIVGGVVWGIGAALHEHTEADHRFGRFMNRDFAQYHVSVNADIHDIDVLFADEDDRVVSSLGAKGVGEIGLVGVSAAVSNAIYHATGKRIRSTPITPDKVMR